MSSDMYDSGAMPINKTARLVVSESWGDEISMKQYAPIFPVCPPIYKTPWNVKDRDLVGKTFGKCLVVGYAGSTGWRGGESHSGARWAIRCSCGYYELRKSSAFKKKEAAKMCCQYCQSVADLKRHDFYRNNGRYPNFKEECQIVVGSV